MHGCRFLVDRLINLGAKDVGLPIAINMYLPTLQVKLDDAQRAGRLHWHEIEAEHLADLDNSDGDDGDGGRDDDNGEDRATHSRSMFDNINGFDGNWEGSDTKAPTPIGHQQTDHLPQVISTGAADATTPAQKAPTTNRPSPPEAHVANYLVPTAQQAIHADSISQEGSHELAASSTQPSTERQQANVLLLSLSEPPCRIGYESPTGVRELLHGGKDMQGGPAAQYGKDRSHLGECIEQGTAAAGNKSPTASHTGPSSVALQPCIAKSRVTREAESNVSAGSLHCADRGMQSVSQADCSCPDALTSMQATDGRPAAEARGTEMHSGHVLEMWSSLHMLLSLVPGEKRPSLHTAPVSPRDDALSLSSFVCIMWQSLRAQACMCG